MSGRDWSGNWHRMAPFECNPDESAGLAEPAPLATYTLRVMGAGEFDALEFNGYLGEAEENLSDLLPEGFYVKIERWDA